MSRLFLFLLAIQYVFYTTKAYKILILNPIPSKSHTILGNGLVKHLSEAGHEITYMTSVLPDMPQPRVNIVDITDNKRVFSTDGVMKIKDIMDKTRTTNNFIYIIKILMNISNNTIANPNVQKFMADESQQFDVVIAEWMFNEIYAGFAGVFNCPLIWFSPVEPHWMMLQLVDEMTNPAFTADIISNNVPPLSFKQRLVELSLQIYRKTLQKFWVAGMENDLYEKFFVPMIKKRHSSVPTLETLRYNASLVLSNSHVSMGIATKLPPNYIPIGGYHIDINVKPLPEDLQRLMDNSNHGVIYFSMGSNLRSNHFPEKVQQEILQLFGKLKQTVIWKFEEELPNRPKNVHILQWAPQQSILAHKNCVLFITHGGLLSTTETVHFGVPVIGIPVFGDQFVNTERSVKKGFAKKIDLSYNIATDLDAAIQDILGDSKYTERVKELSFIYHHRPVHPSKELVHWVEHVIMTRGATHLRSPSLTVPWYQKIFLDLVFCLIIITLVLNYVLRLIYRFLKRKLLFILYKKDKLN